MTRSKSTYEMPWTILGLDLLEWSLLSKTVFISTEIGKIVLMSALCSITTAGHCVIVIMYRLILHP